LRDSVLQEYTGYVFDSPLGAAARFSYQRAALLGVDYQKACTILYQQAASDGLRLCRAKAVNWSPAIPDPTRPLHVHLSDGDSVETEVVIDATGPAQWAARQLGIATSRYDSVCYGELLTGCSVADSSCFRFLAPNSRYGNGGGWVYPIGKDTVSIGYSVVVQASTCDSERLAAGYWAAKKEFQPYSDWTRAGVRQRIEGGTIPVGRIGRFSHDRILIVGDAAGQAHPWSIEGCRPALYNGRSCAHVVLQAFGKKRFDRSMLSLFERQWSKLNRERFWRTASIADIIWTRTDQDWDRFIVAYQHLAPEKQLRYLRDNRASFFHQVYAVGGYARRQFVEWIGRQRA
jgi:flavin-dependent dehydrogenase